MKKAITILFSIVFLSVIILMACNKKIDSQTNQSENEQQSSSSESSSQNRAIPSSGVTVSSRGFLIFESAEIFQDYDDFLRNSSHQQVQNYLTSLSFISLGKTKYSASSQQVSANQLIDYVFDTDRIVQIQGVIFKPTSDNKFMLTVTAGNLNNASFSDLVNENFNNTSMNKFSTFPDENTAPLLFPLINNTPSGYEETTQNEQAGRP